MANEIVKLVAKKANIPEVVAHIAVDTALGFVKTKLPAGVGGILDTFIGSGASAGSSSSAKKSNDNPLGGLGDIAGKLGGLGSLLGKK